MTINKKIVKLTYNKLIKSTHTGGYTMATHKETRERKQAALEFIFNHIRSKSTPVKLNTIYRHFSDVWTYSGNFIQEVSKLAPPDIIIQSKQRSGTFAVYTGKALIPVKTATHTIKKAIMGGIFPHNFEGRITDVKPVDMKPMKKAPKMFENFPETVEVYRMTNIDEYVSYLQVTESGNYLFQQV